jgi:hypothetical protein
MPTMPGWLLGGLATAVLVLHAGFVVFVVAGGALLRRRPRLAFAHLPAAVWAAAIEFSGGVCPLTPLENALRHAAGQRGYDGDFVGHYLLRTLYPEGLTRETQVALGLGVVVLNVLVYAWAWRAWRKGRAARRGR